ncbi:NADH dehydrogenase [candidate division MSBL1 archaeon SCGC-AAA261O19]|uniref:NADH dehydrogenase n=1 Tax=candidate division MSBL1 archaeon SCGC-AAA261O19 TaxID=1698277 RepID=A0A133VEK9_9EURY|nr:NADH dehydrogenase [candidate division MSBL1 archaeon SCGC-AAA261O19]
MKVNTTPSEGHSERGTINLFIGPQHPGSGHMRLEVVLDGDVVVDITPDIGWVHRGVEKVAETKKFIQVIPLVERPAILDSANMNVGYVRAVEKILDSEVPVRARYIRTLICELNRIASHLYGIGILGNMIGTSTLYMWSFADREIILELLQEFTGARLTHSFFLPGGVRDNPPKTFMNELEQGLKYVENRLPDYKALTFDNPAVRGRLEDVGIINKKKAIKLGITGPNLRASGVKYDARMIGDYGAYDELGFKPATRKDGDCFARLMIRIDEIRESIKLVRKIIREMPKGKIMSEETRSINKLVTMDFPEGEAFSRVECGRGELTTFLISDGKDKPNRLRVITPSFRNVIAFREAIVGHRLADIPAVYGSLDYFPPEADR